MKNTILAVALIFLAGCGEAGVEGTLGKIFIMDTGEKKVADSLSKEFVEKLNVDVDDEGVIVSNLRSLQDKDFDLEKNQANALSGLQYIMTMIRRSEFVPDSKRSECQCKYSNDTYIEATKALGHFLVNMHKEKVSELNKDNPETFREAYRQFKIGKDLLEDLTKIDPGLHAKSKGDQEDVTLIKETAKQYLSQLSSESTSDKDTKTDKSDKDKKDSD